MAEPDPHDLTDEERRSVKAALVAVDVDRRVREALDARLPDAVNRELRRRLLRIGLVYVAMLVIAFVALRTTETQTERTRRAGDFSTCVRVQRLRRQLNRFEGTVYGFVQAARLVRGAEAQRTHSKVDEQAAGAYGVIADSIDYQPQSDCVAAADRPGSYVPPGPIPYGRAITERLVPVPAGLVALKRQNQQR